MGEVTRLLANVRRGDDRAYDQLFALVYQELRRIASRQLRREAPGRTLYTTALVHEAYLKLAHDGEIAAEERGHFMGIAARAMRQILVDHARTRKAHKRGGGQRHTSLTNHEPGVNVSYEELLALDSALDRLGTVDPRLRKVVEHRYFAGLSGKETAEALGVTERTVERDWAKARAWLYRDLYAEGE